MKYLLALIIFISSPFVRAENCLYGELVELDSIVNCAQKGDTTAMYGLGEIYFQGKEVPRNYKTAFEWTFKAADQGDKTAQGSLGFYYYNGWGTKKDLLQAYMWWSLSIVYNEEPILRNNIDNLELELSKADLARAQEMASEWMTSHK